MKNPYFQAAALDPSYKAYKDLNPDQQTKARLLVLEYNVTSISGGPRPRGSDAQPPLVVEFERCVFNLRAKHFVWEVAREVYLAQNYKFSHEELRELKAQGLLDP